MSATQFLQSAQALEIWAAQGEGKRVNGVNPTNGQSGFSPGCEWVNYLTGATFKNIGSTTSSFWVQSDPSASSGTAFGVPTTISQAAIMRASGNFYRNILTVANGIQPSATGADKIVDAFTIPAGTFDSAGRGFVATVYGTFGATGNNKLIKVILGATNTNPATNGTVTVTGGTTIGSTGTLTTNGGGLVLTCQLFKTGAAASNTQESMTTGIVAGSTHAGCGSWTDQTFTEANAQLLVVTVNLTTATTDFTYQGMELTGYN